MYCGEERGQLVGGGDRIICSCTSGIVKGSPSQSGFNSSVAIRMASSETVSSSVSMRLSRLARTFCTKGLSCRDNRRACMSWSMSRQRPGVMVSIEAEGTVVDVQV